MTNELQTPWVIKNRNGMNNIDFSSVFLGDLVYSKVHGWGEVVETYPEEDCLRVKFGKFSVSYEYDGYNPCTNEVELATLFQKSFSQSVIHSQIITLMD